MRIISTEGMTRRVMNCNEHVFMNIMRHRNVQYPLSLNIIRTMERGFIFI